MTSAFVPDGREIAEEIYDSLIKEWPDKLRSRTVLGIVVVGEHPVIESFVRIKTRSAERLGVRIERMRLPANATTEEVQGAILALAEHSHGIIVQLPLPAGIFADAVLRSVPKEKDVDAINPATPESERLVLSPVALALAEIFRRGGVRIPGARAVVVGAGRLVGAPSASLLRREGAHVSVFTLTEGSLDDLKEADIVVLGAGKPGLVRPEHLKEGVVLIDAGASEEGGVIRGDADPACAAKASLFTPVPGGIGPIAVAMIFKNLRELATALP